VILLYNRFVPISVVAPELRHGNEMRLHIEATSNSRQLHAVCLQAQAFQSEPLQLLRFGHGEPCESLSVLSVVYTTKNRGNANRKHDRADGSPMSAIGRV
jgi:hypothetical protein